MTRDGAVSDPYRQELEGRNEALRTFIRDRGAEVQAHLRERVRDYLRAQVETPAPALDPLLVTHLKQYLAKKKSAADPVWALWHACRDIPEAQLAERTPELIRGLEARLSPALVAEFSWRLVFLCVAPFAIAAAIAVNIGAPACDDEPRDTARVDYFGAALATLGQLSQASITPSASESVSHSSGTPFELQSMLVPSAISCPSPTPFLLHGPGGPAATGNCLPRPTSTPTSK